MDNEKKNISSIAVIQNPRVGMNSEQMLINLKKMKQH